MPNRYPHRDALRILYLLVHGSFPIEDIDDPGAVAIFKGEARLHAFEFWMRNPDYLAEELLNSYEATLETRYLELVDEIFSADEPDLRRFPMIRYRFGAYEKLDDAMAFLTCRNLVKILGHKKIQTVSEWDFLVMKDAIELTQSVAKEFEALRWYEERAKLIAELAGGRGGAELKKRQYEQLEYADTPLGNVIPSIKERVLSRRKSFLVS